MHCAFVLLAFFICSVSAADRADPLPCNGHPELCSKLYSSVVYPTTHNSYAFGPFPAANQKYSIRRQLLDGIRGFMLDGWYPSKTNQTVIELCHTDCALLDAGSLTDTLKLLAKFMNENPREVITILLENSGSIPAAKFAESFTEANIVSLIYTPPSTTAAWPTLESMIQSNKRLVVFTGSGADAAVAPWMLNEFDYVWETPFSYTSEAEFNCNIDRPKGEKRPMYVLNHFIHGLITIGGTTIEVPEPTQAASINSAESLTRHATACTTSAGSVPNFVAVDFYQDGDLLKVVAALNNVEYIPPAAQPDEEESSKTGASDSLQRGLLTVLSAMIGLFICTA